jgi:purine-binding chemotaxis protein CheW
VSAVSVRLGSALYGIPVHRVLRVLRPPPVSRVPFPPPDVLGVAQVGGALLAVLDLGTRLGGAPAVHPGRLLVVRPGRGREPVALRVDGVGGLVDDEAAGPPEPAEAAAALPEGWITGVARLDDGRRVALLDLERVLGENG